MNKTIFDVHEITNEGYLDLLRSTIEELNPAAVKKLLLSIAKVDISNDLEPFAVILDADSANNSSRTIWSCPSFVVTDTVVEYEDE